ncbi:MAG: PAS domain S-box protein, partial [Methanobacteriota archaeon]
VFSPSPEQECINISGFDISDQKELEKGSESKNERYVGGIGIDATDHVHAEEELWESKARIESIFRSSPIGIGVVVNRMIKEANERLCEITGYSREELLGKSALMLYPTEEEYERVGMVKYGMIGERGAGYVETRWQRKDGSVIDILLSSSPIVSGDLSGEITFTALDITDRKRAEESLKKAYDRLEEKVKERTEELEKAYKSLKESERGLAEAQRMANIGNLNWDLVTGEVYWSDEMYRIFRLNPQESDRTYEKFLSYVHPEDRDIVDNSFKNGLNGETIEGDYRIILPDGEERVLSTHLEVIFDERKKNPVRIRGIFQDITGRKRAEEVVIESEARYKDLFVAISSGVAVYDVIDDGSDFVFKDINPAGEHIDNVRREDIIGKSIYELFPNVGEMGLDAVFRRVWHTGRPEFFPLTMYKDKRISLWVTNYIYRLPSGELVAVFDDITERKKAEEALTIIETARKKEIHHRIKNNLQVISSLLDLQAEQFNNRDSIRNSEVLKAFRESQDRVISMALIHEELYRGSGFETLNFSSYIKELAENLFKTYSVGNIGISLNMDLEENAFFDMDIAVPLGIIINELVSNSLKHAFIWRDKGEIRIKLYREENGECITSIEESVDCNTGFVLKVSDNGVGIPENLDIKELDSLGFQLVTSLVDQLDGEFELKKNNGTEFTMRFTVT